MCNYMVATQISWLVRCLSCAPGFSQSNQQYNQEPPTLPLHYSPTFPTLSANYTPAFPILPPHYRPTSLTLPPHSPPTFPTLPPHSPPTFSTFPIHYSPTFLAHHPLNDKQNTNILTLRRQGGKYL